MTRVRVYDDFDSLLATIEAEDIHVIFPEPLHESAEKLLRTLGVTWGYDTRAPVLGTTHDPNDRGQPKRHYTPEQKAARSRRRREARQRKKAAGG